MTADDSTTPRSRDAERAPADGADGWRLCGRRLGSRLLLGTAQFATPELMQRALIASGAELVTVSLRRQAPQRRGGESMWRHIRELGLNLLPNTAGCHSADEAVTLARMAREVFETDWIKLEVIGDDYNLQPDPVALLEATGRLLRDGFTVLPYCTDDLVLCRRLADLGCEALMPWGAPIGTARGLMNPYALETLRARLPEHALIVDAGLGLPSHAARAMELGFDGVLLNTAVARSADPVRMARAFADAVRAGRLAHGAGPVPERQTARASTPTLGTPFWRESECPNP